MKKIFIAALILIIGMPAFAEISVPFFGGNSFSMDVETIFSADLNSGSTGLNTIAGVGLWFEYVPYQDRNITPRRDALSVSLRMSNSAIYGWRGYGFTDEDSGRFNNGFLSGFIPKPDDVTVDQAMSIWFDTFIAQLEYNQYWFRIAGIEPEITLSQASIKSVFDPVIENRTAIDKNRMFLPLFHTAAHYRPWPNHGIVSVIGRDLVHLNRAEVAIAGNLSAGMKTDYIDLTLKVGSWKPVEQNVDNSWVTGLDFTWRPDFSNLLNFSFLGAVNYGTVNLDNDKDKNDPMANPNALVENPLAFGLGYEYRLDMGRRMILKPYVGVDFIYETKINNFDWEIGGGIQWFFRGTGAQFKRNTSIGGARIGDVEIPAALIIGVNANRAGVVNGVISINEDPRSSLIPNFGGFVLVELMNIGSQEYKAANGLNYNDFLWAGVVQLEYLLNEKMTLYTFAQYMPAIMPKDLRADDPVFGKEYLTLTTRLGCQFTPFNHFTIDAWYERNDTAENNVWKLDNGLIYINFKISL